jgi:phosphoglucomutase
MEPATRQGFNPEVRFCHNLQSRVPQRFAGEQLKTISDKVGSCFPKRKNFRLTPEVRQKFTEKLRQNPREFCGHAVSQVVRTDGLKLVFSDGSWVCYRLSGTEPVVRAYSEARSERGLEKLSTAAKLWIFE